MEKMMLPEIKATNVFQRNWNAQTRIVANEGGARSSKTISIAQLFILTAASETKPCVYSIVRKTSPALRGTVMRDFFEWLEILKLYNPNNHRKVDGTYKLGNTLIEFLAVDQAQKIKGRKRKKLWINEANELTLEDWRQLALRTTSQIFLDYNPSEIEHWIYDKVLTRSDVTLIHSSYKDNPFLDDITLSEIELLKNEDENYWKVYGLGERAVSQSRIYTNWQITDKWPENPDEVIGGLDFGFNNQTALIEIAIKDTVVYGRQKIYQTHLTNSQLIDILKERWNKKFIIYADAAEPQRIEEIKNAGFWIVAADKDVEKGIDSVKSKKLFFLKDSIDLINEGTKYSWKQKDGKSIDEPVKFLDHLMDALRYAIHTHFKNIKKEIRIRLL